MQQNSPQARRLTALLAVLIGLSVFAIVVVARRQEVNSETSRSSQIEELSLNSFSKKVLQNDQVLLLDVRPKTDYAAGHIPNSVSIPSYELGTHEDELRLFAEWDVILICAADGCPEMQSGIQNLEQLGLTNIYALEGGFESYKNAELAVASQAQLIQDDLAELLNAIEVPEITVPELANKLKQTDLVIIDGRTSFEFVTGFVPGAINIPLHTFGKAMELGFITRDATIIVYDRVGNRSKIGVEALMDAGYEDVFSLTGGIEAWRTAEQPIELPREDGSDLPGLIPVLYPDQAQ